MLTVIFFFFKQKTAYEMRISDWSSDVGSSDLEEELCVSRSPLAVAGTAADLVKTPHRISIQAPCGAPARWPDYPREKRWRSTILLHSSEIGFAPPQKRSNTFTALRRSEEHTSELQSLMRISYAVFCLKKKKK